MEENTNLKNEEKASLKKDEELVEANNVDTSVKTDNNLEQKILDETEINKKNAGFWTDQNGALEMRGLVTAIIVPFGGICGSVICFLRKQKKQAIYYIFIVIAFMALYFSYFTNYLFHKNSEPYQYKKWARWCRSNLRYITGSVEMYNMDHQNAKMTQLDIDLLKKEKYISSLEIPKPTPYCKYELSNHGDVYCLEHGTYEDLCRVWNLLPR